MIGDRSGPTRRSVPRQRNHEDRREAPRCPREQVGAVGRRRIMLLRAIRTHRHQAWDDHGFSDAVTGLRAPSPQLRAGRPAAPFRCERRPDRRWRVRGSGVRSNRSTGPSTDPVSRRCQRRRRVHGQTNREGSNNTTLCTIMVNTGQHPEQTWLLAIETRSGQRRRRVVE